MHAEVAFDLIRSAVQLSLLLAGPLLVAAVVAGLLSGMFQTAFQIHEHSLSFVPRLVAVALALVASLPWLLSRLSEFAHQLISQAPHRF